MDNVDVSTLVLPGRPTDRNDRQLKLVTLPLPSSAKRSMGAVKQEYIPHALHVVPRIPRSITNPEIVTKKRNSYRIPPSGPPSRTVEQRDLWWLGDRALSNGIRINLLCPQGQKKEAVERLLRENTRIKSGHVTVGNGSRQRQLGTSRADNNPTLVITTKTKDRRPNTIQMDLLSEGYLTRTGEPPDLYPALIAPRGVLRISENPIKPLTRHNSIHGHVNRRSHGNQVLKRERTSISAGGFRPDHRHPNTPSLPSLSPRTISSLSTERSISELSLPDELWVASPTKRSSPRQHHGERRQVWQSEERGRPGWQVDNTTSPLLNQANERHGSHIITGPGQEHAITSPSDNTRLTSPPTQASKEQDSTTHRNVQRSKANNQVHILNIGAGVNRQSAGKTYVNSVLNGTNATAYEKAKELKMKEKIQQANLSLSQYFCVSVGGRDQNKGKNSPEPKAAFEASILEVQRAEIKSKPTRKTNRNIKRNVRFSLDTKVHEYTPRSPVHDDPPD